MAQSDATLAESYRRCYWSSLGKSLVGAPSGGCCTRKAGAVKKACAPLSATRPGYTPCAACTWRPLRTSLMWPTFIFSTRPACFWITHVAMAGPWARGGGRAASTQPLADANWRLVRAQAARTTGAGRSLKSAQLCLVYQPYPGPAVPARGHAGSLRVHPLTRLREWLAGRGIEVLFLPPCSPDFTPI